MKKARLLEIIVECDKQADTLEGSNCNECPLGHLEIPLSVDAEFYGSVSAVKLTMSPCLMIAELAKKIKEPRKTK